MKKKNVFTCVFILLIIGVFIYIAVYSKQGKMGNPRTGDNRFSLHCEKISILLDNKEVTSIEGDEKQKLIDEFSNGAISDDYDVDVPFDESYNITVDFNNGISKIYMREEDNYMYLKKSGQSSFRYRLDKDVHKLILQLIGESR